MMLLRQNDVTGNPCGAAEDVRFLAIAATGTVTVTDESNKKVALATIGPGKLVDVRKGAEVGPIISMTCDFEFSAEIDGFPKILSFDVAWDKVAQHVSVDANASDIASGSLVLKKSL